MSNNEDLNNALFNSKRKKFLGFNTGQYIKTYFGSTALASILILSLITIFLFKEGYGFFSQNLDSLRLYRKAGLEYVDIIRQQNEDFQAINRYANSIRVEHSRILDEKEGMNFVEVQKTIKQDLPFYNEFSSVNRSMTSFLSDISEEATAIREQALVNKNLELKKQFITEKIDRITKKQRMTEGDLFEYANKLKTLSNANAGNPDLQQKYSFKAHKAESGEFNQESIAHFAELLTADREAIVINPIPFEDEVKKVTAYFDEYKNQSELLIGNLNTVLEKPLNFPKYPSLQAKVERLDELCRQYIGTFEASFQKMENWKYDEPIAPVTALFAFLSGKDWTTASDWQDVYGLLPLLTGSLVVSGIALTFAIPFGVGAAIYVNQLATPREQNLIKPYIEFISAIPSVVIGFFGIAVFGTFIRYVSQLDAFAWVPFFPLSERLNAFTAGGLLALMAIPTIFTLCEDALNNVPRSFKEASFALGGNRLQTIFRILLPCALSGVISAILLGFGRVIGETMVVLLCAGNRIKIPDFTEGLGVFFQPVHTMTGIVAQEMGEVVNGSIHYRALFVVGIVLFFLSLLVNYFSQMIVRKYKISNG